MSVPSQPTSLSLLEQVRSQSDPYAWRILVEFYTPLLHAWLTAANLQSADRDDLTQRVLEVLARQLPGFQHNGRTGAFRAWLRGMTVNFLKEFWRQRPSPATDSVLEQLSDPHGRLSLIWDKQHDQHVYQGLVAIVRREVTETTWQAFHRTALESCCRALEAVPADSFVGRLKGAEQAAFATTADGSSATLHEVTGIPPELANHPRYRVLSLIGQGGMGAVYKTEHRRMERLVALKVINPGLLKNPATVARFQ